MVYVVELWVATLTINLCALILGATLSRPLTDLQTRYIVCVINKMTLLVHDTVDKVVIYISMHIKVLYRSSLIIIQSCCFLSYIWGVLSKLQKVSPWS